MRMSRRTFLQRAAFGAAAMALPAHRAAAAGRTPNVVIIFCDDLGYGDLAGFGSTNIRTPNLDRMAAEGQKWTSFYVAGPVCTPSRAGLMTGRYPIRSGMCSAERPVLFPDSGSGLPPGEITIAEMLKQKGYATGCFGKWHLGHLPPYLPTRQGFDTYFGIPYSNDMDAQPEAKEYHRRSRIEAGFQPQHGWWNAPLMRDEEIVERPADQRTITRRYADEAIGFIRQHKEQPFFVYLANSMPHIPLFASDDFRGQSPRGLYGDVVEEIDYHVGRVLQTLRDEGLAENTLVLFTSDQGAGKSPPLRGGKGKLSEGGIRTPFVARWPGHIPAGAVSDAFCSTLDLFPTFLRLAGAQPPGVKLDGYDMLPVLTEGAASKRTEQFWELRGQRAARVGNWKWLVETRGRWDLPEDTTGELYDLSADPEERHNLALQEPAVLRMMQQKWDAWMREMVASEDRGPFGKVYFDKLGYGNGDYRLDE